jgi:hypothetical protein
MGMTSQVSLFIDATAFVLLFVVALIAAWRGGTGIQYG